MRKDLERRLSAVEAAQRGNDRTRYVWAWGHESHEDALARQNAEWIAGGFSAVTVDDVTFIRSWLAKGAEHADA